MKWDLIITIKLVKMKLGWRVTNYSLGNPRLHVLNACSQHFKSSEKKFLYNILVSFYIETVDL